MLQELLNVVTHMIPAVIHVPNPEGVNMINIVFQEMVTNTEIISIHLPRHIANMVAVTKLLQELPRMVIHMIHAVIHVPNPKEVNMEEIVFQEMVTKVTQHAELPTNGINENLNQCMEIRL